MNLLGTNPKVLLCTLGFLLGLSLSWAQHERTYPDRVLRHNLQKNVIRAARTGLHDSNAPKIEKISTQAPLGGNLFMHCPVPPGEDLQVSWIRLPNWRIISSGRVTYTHDERYRVLHIDGTNEWTLQIKYVNLTDGGSYECQVSTGSGIASRVMYNVTILVPTTSIVEGAEYHMDRGSRIHLTCIIHNVPQLPQFVFWYHNDRMINYDMLGRHRVEVRTEKVQQDTGDIVTSHLTIKEASDLDSGNYTCVPSNSQSTSTLIFVSEGDEAAAIQGVDQEIPVVHPIPSGGLRQVSSHSISVLLLSNWLMMSFCHR